MRADLPGADPLTQALLRSMASTWSEVASLASTGLGGIVEAGYENLLTSLAVVSLFPEVSALLRQPALDAGAGPARKARDAIAAQASGPVQIGHIARDLGISMRSLQESFQRHYGCSPRKFLMDCRLHLARDTLLKPSRDSVTEVALSCGFSDLGAFSARYRETFGELPSQTRRRVRG